MRVTASSRLVRSEEIVVLRFFRDLTFLYSESLFKMILNSNNISALSSITIRFIAPPIISIIFCNEKADMDYA